MKALEAHVHRQIDRSRDFFWHRVRHRAVATHLPANRSFALVDVGAGAGLLGEFLADSYPGATYMFVEPLHSLEAHLEGRYGERANARGLESFEGIDFVALLDVLEHQEDDAAFLEELVQRMRPGAVLLVTVPALPRLWSAWDIALGHHRRYTRSSLRTCFAGLPLEPIEVSYMFPELIPLGWARRLRSADRVGEASDEASFPDLPRPLNAALYAVGSASLRLRHLWPAGTSLLAAMRRV